MKHLLTLVALSAATLFGQTSFWTPTTYRGAFAPAPTAQWTDGWTNWDPQYTAYPASTDVVTGEINSAGTWTSNKVYLIQFQ